MVSHAAALREHWEGTPDDWRALVRQLHEAGVEAGELPLRTGAAHLILEVDRLPGLDDVDRALLRYALRLAWAPGSVSAADLAGPREAGLNDRALLDIAQIVACFSYMNRLADGMGVGLDPRSHGVARDLFGAQALADHMAWAAGRSPSDAPDQGGGDGM